MKIGFVLDDGLDKPDGVQQYILTLGNWYKKNGHEVRYLVGQTKRTDLDDVFPMARNVRVRFNGNVMGIPLPTSKKLIRQLLAKEKFDVLHVQVPYSPFFGARVIKCADSSTVVIGTFHILPYNSISSIGTGLLGTWLKSSLSRFDAHVSVSKPAADFAKKTFGIDSKVIPNSVIISQFKPDKAVVRGDDLRILFLGRLVHRKGCQNLLAALSILKQQNKLPKNLVVDVCGSGAMKSKLEAYAKDSSLDKIVNFHGFVSDSQKIEYMQNANIAVFPSLSGESFGIVLIEAMAAGSEIVLGGNNPGYESVLADVPDSIINAHNVEVFANQLHGFISSKSKRTALNLAQQEHVKQFDTDIVAKKLLALYDSCKTAQRDR